LLNSTALTKIQAIFLVSIIVIAFSGCIIYILINQDQSSETIKIGVCCDIQNSGDKAFYQGAVLAAEQINSQGGALGRNFEIIVEDDDSSQLDAVVASKAFTKLITIHNVDFVLSPSSFTATTYQEIASQHKIILMGSGSDEASQRVLDDYENFKYYFRMGTNTTINTASTINSFVDCREYTGFNKVGFLYELILTKWVSMIINQLTEKGFEIVYNTAIPSDTVDYSSFFARAEAAGVEILYPYIAGTAGIPFVKEYYDRQAPMVMWGMITMASQSDFWEATGGKCEYTTNNGFPIVAGYPFTSYTVPTREAYIERWNEQAKSSSGYGYDVVRFVLPEAIEHAGTIDAEAVIQALETITVDTSSQREFAFAPNHEILVKAGATGRVCMFQWQDGEQVPLWPKIIKEEAGATYKFPPWSGPWDNFN